MEEREEVNISPDLISSSEALRLIFWRVRLDRWTRVCLGSWMSLIPWVCRGGDCILICMFLWAEVKGQAVCLHMYWPKEGGRMFSVCNNSHQWLQAHLLCAVRTGGKLMQVDGCPNSRTEADFPKLWACFFGAQSSHNQLSCHYRRCGVKTFQTAHGSLSSMSSGHFTASRALKILRYYQNTQQIYYIVNMQLLRIYKNSVCS